MTKTLFNIRMLRGLLASVNNLYIIIPGGFDLQVEAVSTRFPWIKRENGYLKLVQFE